MRKLFKWIGIILGGLLGLPVIAAVAFYFVGGAQLSKKYDVPVEAVSIPMDSGVVARGEHLTTILNSVNHRFVTLCVRSQCSLRQAQDRLLATKNLLPFAPRLFVRNERSLTPSRCPSGE
jgi:hypothetical protein